MAPAMKLTTSLFPFSTHSKKSPKNLRIGPALVNAILASLFLTLLSKNSLALDPEDTSELCVVRDLERRHVSPWLSEPRNTPGCSSHGQLSADGTEVHIIRALLDKGPSQALLKPASDGLTPIDLLLDPKDLNSSAAPFALLLSSDRPVLWRISGRGLSPGRPHQVLVCSKCRVESALALQVEGREWPSKKALLRFARKKRWGAITSFTEVRAANRIELTVGFGLMGGRTSECDTNSTLMSPVASASAVVLQRARGCFNRRLVGSISNDVYVVEVARRDLIRHREAPPSVHVNLQGENGRTVKKNITLFLKAHRSTRWQLISHGIIGKIVVISDQQVENSDIGAKQSIEVRNTELPDKMDSLLLSAINYGPLVLYARVDNASGLDVVISDGKEELDEEQLSGDMAGEDKITDSSSLIHPQQVPEQHSYVRSTISSSTKNEELRHSPMDDLRKEMAVSCEPTRMNITFPRSLAEKLGVRTISLKNPSCKPESNETHIWLSTHITSCNTLSSSENDRTVYSNAVHVKFGTDGWNGKNDYDEIDDDDEKLSVVCKYYLKFPGMILVASGGEEVEAEPTDEEPPKGNGHSLYMMDLFKDKDRTDLLSFDDGPAIVSFDDKLFVKTWIESNLPVQLVPEVCWISNTSDHRSSKSGRIYLVKKSCAVDLTVEIEDTGGRPKNHHGGFNFLVTRAYSEMNLLYLHCALGLCTHKPEHAKGNLIICANQAQNCFKGSLNYFASTAQQVITRGPIKPVPRKLKALQPPEKLPSGSAVPPVAPVHLPVSPYNGLTTKSPSVQHTPVPETRSTSVTHGNISTEMAAVIALIAFMVGVIVTGSMWFIHIKTDPHRNGRKGQVQGPLSSSQQQRPSPALAMNGQQASSAAI